MAGAGKGRPRVAILGGGFAGLAAARELSAATHDVTLVDQRTAFEFLPNIHELLSGVKTPERLRLSLGSSLAALGHRFVNDRVLGVDPDARSVATAGAEIGYDALIVALGGVDATRGVVGVTEYTHPFKSVDDCARIGRRLAALAEHQEPASVVVVGGGLEGVEALGEILRCYRHKPLSVTVVEARERLLPEAPAALDAHLRGLCEPHDVTFRMNSPVEKVYPDRVLLGAGGSVPADLVIWTGGPAPPPLLSGSGLAAPDGGWANVDAALQSELSDQIFVAGDSAGVPGGISKQAYHALDMGEWAARNARRRLNGAEPTAFSPAPKPTLISFGDLTCYLVSGDRVLAGALLASAKEAVFELTMAQLDPAPPWRRVPHAALRGAEAVRRLAVPTLLSPRAVLRQANLRLL